MRVSEAINSRRSMRIFKPDPVPQADIEWIISTASRAASNGNLQPWKLYVTTGKARLAVEMIHSMSACGTGSGLKTRIERRELTASDTRMKDQLRLRWRRRNSNSLRKAMPYSCSLK